MSQSDPACAPLALIVPADDMSAALKLGLPTALLSGSTEAGRLVLTEAGAMLVPSAQTTRVAGCLALTSDTLPSARTIIEAWTETTGLGLPLIDMSEEIPSARAVAVLRETARLYGERMRKLALQNAELMEMLALLRVEHEDQGIALRKTRNFLLKTVESRRWLAQAHGPLSRDTPSQFRLAPRVTLIQRLAAGSAGLSDLGVFLPDQHWPQTGVLRVRLHLVESDMVKASWDIPAAKLAPGWLRLTLLDALEDDDQTLRLELSWEGTEALLLGAGLHHPDPVLCADLAGERQSQLLAHRIWKYIPGARAPLPADGHWTASSGVAPVSIDPEHLSQALPVDPDGSRVQYFPNLEALQVHPQPEGLSAARLAGVVAPGLREITATIGGRDERVPAVEYALAVAPHHPLREIGDLVADCARRGHMSDWVCLSGDREGDLRLILPEPLKQVCDLFLVTRLAPRAAPAFGWATFRNIRMMAGPA